LGLAIVSSFQLDPIISGISVSPSLSSQQCQPAKPLISAATAETKQVNT